LRAMEGFNAVGMLNPANLCLVKNLNVPHDFVLPKFSLFDGTGVPLDHLTMYCRRMQPYASDEKVLMHYFQDSLTGAAQRWFNTLNPSSVASWEDLAEMFMKQYKHNEEKIPTIYDLQNTAMKSGESFREFAHRWRDLAAQIIPPLSEKDLLNAFIDALHEPYTSNLAGGGHSNLADMIQAGERVERCMKRGTLYYPTLDKSDPAKASKGKKAEQEFLKIIRQSEYMIVDQLKKTPAKISILELIMSSEPHRQVLMRMLNQAYVSDKIPTDSFNGIVGNVLASHLLSFTEDDIPPEGMGHNKALHISAMCRGKELASILVDNGSSLNILPKETFEKLPIDRSYLRPVPMVVRAFDGTRREIMGEIEIPLQVASVTFNVPFVVMDISPTYSCLLGRPWIHTAGAVPSSLHQMLKFIHDGRVYIVKGQSEWMVASLEIEILPEMLRQVNQEEKIIQPHQEVTEVVNLGTEMEKKEVKVGAAFEGENKKKLIDLLHNYQDVFAWSYQDMPGLDTSIVVHKLPLILECTLVKQKLRRLKADMLLKIRDEVKKQFDAGFLAVARYPEWVANIVPVPKKDGKVRMCVDYRDLNRARPKDNFPLPHIDVLVDNTARHSNFSFMDGFSGYNQIKMAPEDREKTTFITLWGTFCYKVMSFGLKNAGATYQRAMVTLFHDMMHREVEVYVDDMIAKSKEGEDHIVNLQKLFDRLRKHQLKLNPAKCTFGATSGKLLGFIVSRKGIEVDPDKVKAILEMPPPRTEKEVRGFLGRLNYIARFISQLTATCEPIFKLLRKSNSTEWNEDCQIAFEKIKQYLKSPPVLMPPVAGRPLILYLTVSDSSMGCVLGQHDSSGRIEHVIYYLSKKFTSCEANYSMLEKTCCSLVWAAHRLRQYMLYHTTWLISKMDPIKYIFEKPSLSGRIAKWQMLLSEYDILYVTQKAIKGSAIADYLADGAIDDAQSMDLKFPDIDVMTVSIEEGNQKDLAKWTMLFDGASNIMGCGIGAVLISPDENIIPFTAKLYFECTNNVAEYEACTMGIQVAIDMGIRRLQVYGDSQLVIRQLNDEWETKDDKLIPYYQHIKKLFKFFDWIEFDHIPREENQIADALATLTAIWILPAFDMIFLLVADCVWLLFGLYGCWLLAAFVWLLVAGGLRLIVDSCWLHLIC
ncbi:uncharacterized protein LOC119980745, partial [Tripterygium wilfordii]|uniref:uncharacterized protein LOC119980745 n=1 Tax=Tripterygium wilfordii TaxID=458696 RepID=UPI0018F7E52A